MVCWFVVKKNNKHMHWGQKENTGQCCQKVRDHNKNVIFSSGNNQRFEDLETLEKL